MPIVITTLANGLIIFIYLDELHLRLNHLPTVKLNGQKFGSQASHFIPCLIQPFQSNDQELVNVWYYFSLKELKESTASRP